ncbi:HesA/MoeB/ThiF family protein [Candidatus Woesearchaeota archaeon]|nr:HesA/MoeB/ThiF family protein [Candidatus Woesearchaeota archaeon]
MHRYDRQITLIGDENQKKLESSTVTIVGTGALGSACAELLGRAGIGNLRVIDDDIVHLSNLQRQHLFSESDIAKNKARIAAMKLKKINPTITITPIAERLTKENTGLLEGLIIDCTDNHKTRLLIDDYCKENDLLWIHGAAAGVNGQVLVVDKKTNYQKLHPTDKAERKASDVGILNTITTIIGSLQANEAIKILTGKQHEKKLVRVNVNTLKFDKIKV